MNFKSLCILVATLFVACGGSSNITPEVLTQGTVVSKQYQPARTYKKIDPATGKLKTFFDDPDYVVSFENLQFKVGGGLTRTVYVAKSIYDTLKVGGSINLSGVAYENPE